MKKLEEEIEEQELKDYSFIDLENKIIYIYGDITEETGLEVSKKIKELDASEGDIIVKINSPGGSMDPGISIMTEIINCKNNVITDVTGIAFSGGAFITLSGDYRRISKLGSIMLHYPSFSMSDSTERVEEYTTYVREHFNRIMNILLKDTKLSLKAFNSKCENKNWYLTPSEALKLGLVHEVY